MRRNIVILETVGHGQSGLLNPTSPMTAEKYKKRNALPKLATHFVLRFRMGLNQRPPD